MQVDIDRSIKPNHMADLDRAADQQQEPTDQT